MKIGDTMGDIWIFVTDLEASAHPARERCLATNSGSVSVTLAAATATQAAAHSGYTM